jgi:hypothetical protein
VRVEERKENEPMKAEITTRFNNGNLKETKYEAVKSN